MPVFYDTHAHLDFPDFASDCAQVIQRAEAAEIRRIIAIGTDLVSSVRAVQLSEAYPGVFAAVGWHPCHVSEAPADIRPALRELARHPKVVAIGETGLDYYHLPSRREGGDPAADERHKQKQATIFQQQMEVAADLGLNCIVHQRASMEDVLAQMRPFVGRVRGVFHCFSGSVEDLGRILAMGSLVSYTGILTFKNGANVREALAATPLDQFMLETDSPYLAPIPYRGKRCEPAFVKETAVVAAQTRAISLEELSAATCATAHRFFAKLGAG